MLDGEGKRFDTSSGGDRWIQSSSWTHRGEPLTFVPYDEATQTAQKACAAHHKTARLRNTANFGLGERYAPNPRLAVRGFA